MLDIHSIYNELQAVGHGGKSAVIKRHSEFYNISPATLRRMIQKKFGKQKESPKEVLYTDDLILEIGRLKTKTGMMGLGGREVSTEIILEFLREQGYPGADKITVSTANRRLEEMGFNEKTPYVRIEAEYANQQHQLDLSRSKYFQYEKYDSKTNKHILKVSGKALFYKDNDMRLRTWLVGIVDSFSRINLIQAYPATGESLGLVTQFLNFCYGREEDEHAFRSLPEVLKTDNGTFVNKSFKAMLNCLDVKLELVEPYKKRGIQKAESKWKSLWSRFELPLAMRLGEGKTILLEDYNDLIHEHLVNEQNEKHPLRPESRLLAYKRSIAAHPEKLVETDLREIAFRVFERIVGQDLQVSINTEKFLVPESMGLVGKKIRIYSNLAGEFVGEDINGLSKPFTLTPTKGYVTIGDYEHRPKKSIRDKLETQIKREEKEQKINTIPSRKIKVEPETKFTEAIKTEEYIFPTEYKAKEYIGSKLPEGLTYPDVKEVFNSYLDKPKSEIDDLIELLKQQYYKQNLG